ncbi:hypothetical protein ATANTOWER_030554 [Ataeniobius toweri]|uniref:Uncharacterized protein n=1 Tax=Ataeniobius toweri TaxID=208326 RepID=A0ABU7C620_9TELE|nr:hypothetical protein [Ataeniobius toweri]
MCGSKKKTNNQSLQENWQPLPSQESREDSQDVKRTWSINSLHPQTDSRHGLQLFRSFGSEPEPTLEALFQGLGNKDCTVIQWFKVLFLDEKLHFVHFHANTCSNDHGVTVLD